MAFEDREDFYAIVTDSVDDAVGALQHLTNVVAPELRNPTPGQGCASRAFGGSYQHSDPSLSRNRIVGGDEVTDRIEIRDRPIRPHHSDPLR